MKESKRDALIFAGCIVMLGGMALGIKHLTGGYTAPAPPQNVYIGHYGFTITLSPETAKTRRMFGAFTNAEKTSEAVFVMPKEMKDDEPFGVSEARYKEWGIVRLEVNPNKTFPPGTDIVKAARYAVGESLKEKKEPFQITDINLPLPGFVVDIKAPTPIRQVFLRGAKVHYLFTADPGNTALGEAVEGLSEIDPTDAPGK